jgi:hypothetical protein
MASRAEYVAFLDSDDSWAPTCLAKLHAALVARPNAVLCYCGWQNLGLPGGRGKPFIPPDYEGPHKRTLLFSECRWPIHAALVRRQAVVAAGGFDTDLTHSEDFLLWLEIGGTRPIVRVPEVLAFYHFGDQNQASHNRAELAIGMLHAQTSYLRAHPDFGAQLGAKKNEILARGLRERGFDCYWKRDLKAARIIFRHMLKRGYGEARDLKYLLPALLPYSLHKLLLESFE